MNNTPHGIVDGIADGVAGGAKALVSSVASGLRGVGGSLQTALDAPFNAIGAPEQPLRVADRALNGFVAGAANAISQGTIGSLQTTGKGIVNALNHPVEQLGIPPALGDMGGGMSRFPKPPKLGNFKAPRW